MVIDKTPIWEGVVEYYYDNVHFEHGAPRNIYDWLKQEYDITSDTGSTVLECNDQKKAVWFMLKHQ